MNKYKKEKYINQRQLKSGWSFQVIIRKDKYTIIETFNERDYGSARLAFDCAVNYRNRKLNEINEKRYSPSSSLTLREVLEESGVLNNFNMKTKRNHISIFNRFVENVSLNDFTPEFMIQTLNKVSLSQPDETIGRVLSLFKQIDNVAILKQYYLIPRTFGVKAPKSKKIIDFKPERITDVNTLEAVVKECKDEIIKSIIITAYYTGMRPAEIFALNKTDIRDGFIYVNKQIGSNTEEEGIVRNTKTSGSKRSIPISKYLMPVLKRLEGPILFPWSPGEYFTSNRFNARTARLFRPYNLSLYKCRHLFATTLEYSGVDRRTIDVLMGHTFKTSTDIYVHTNKEKMIEAIDKLGDHFSNIWFL